MAQRLKLAWATGGLVAGVAATRLAGEVEGKLKPWRHPLGMHE